MLVQLVGIIYLKHMRAVIVEFVAARPWRFRDLAFDGFGNIIVKVIVMT